MKPTIPAYRNLSCQYITEALFRLMARESYQGITISQITMEAGVARRTFYLNYSSKDDILDQHYEILIRKYNEGFTREMENDLHRQAAYFFAFWNEQREYTSLLEKNGILYKLIDRFHLYLDSMNNPALKASTAAEQEYIFSYIAGGLWMMLRTWLQNGFQETPEQLADIYSKLSGISYNA